MGFYLVMVGIVVILGLVLWARSVPRPADLGPGPDGKLAPCPDTPNCVSSMASDEEHAMEPWPYTGTTEEAHARLMLILRLLPDVKVVAEDKTYIGAEFRVGQIFMDDVEFLIDPQNRLVHFRSASRIGRGDFGVNRKRMQRIGEAFRVTAPESRPAPAESDSLPIGPPALGDDDETSL
jgi:uncharacterized protein (DUF1499 family)